MDPQIAQVIGRIPNLTPEQRDALSKVDLASFADSENKADGTHGFSATAALSIVHDSVEFEVFAVARLAILGILAGDESLVKPWTDAVGAFETAVDAPSEPVANATEQSTEPVVEAPHTPTEAELADLGSPAVEEVSAQEVALEEVPLDIQEGEINV